MYSYINRFVIDEYQQNTNMDREMGDHQLLDEQNCSEATIKKPSKVKLVRRESSRLQNFLMKKIKFNNNG